MGQNLHNDKLFQAAQDQLKDYDAPYDEGSWEKLSKALDQQPKGGRMRWSFSLNGVIIAVAVGTLAFAGWKFFGSSNAPEKAAVPQTAPATVVSNPAPAAQQAASVSTNAPIASTATSPAKTGPEAVAEVTTVSSTGTAEVVKKQRHPHDASTDNATVLVGAPTVQGTYTFGEGDATDIPANNGVSGKEEPFIFPDMIDPVRGIKRHTHENPEVYNGFTPPDPYKLNYYDAPGKKVNLSPDSAPNKDKKDSAKGSAQPH